MTIHVPQPQQNPLSRYPCPVCGGSPPEIISRKVFAETAVGITCAYCRGVGYDVHNRQVIDYLATARNQPLSGR